MPQHNDTMDDSKILVRKIRKALHVIAFLFIFALLANQAQATSNCTLPIQGTAFDNNAVIVSGDVTISIHDALTGGSQIHSETFTGGISASRFDVTLEDWDCDYEQAYYVDATVAGSDVDWGSSSLERQPWVSWRGEVSSIGTIVEARNNEGGAIAAGKAVYINGATGAFTQVGIADNTVSGKSEFFGLALDASNNGDTTNILNTGFYDAFNTVGWSGGDELYLTTSGDLTNTIPTAGVVWHVAYVLTIGGAGDIQVVAKHPEFTNIATVAGTDMNFRTGDAAAANSFDFRDSANALVAQIDSNGGSTFTSVELGGGAVTSASTITAETNTLLSLVTDAGDNLRFTLGDDVGANVQGWYDSTTTNEVGSVDSDGNLQMDGICACDSYTDVSSADITNGAIVNEDVNAAAAIATSKLAVDADIAFGGSFHLTGLAAGSANGDSVRFEDAVKYADARTYMGVFTRDVTTATGTQPITGVGFTPTHLIFNSVISSALGTASWGMDDGTNRLGIRDIESITAGQYVPANAFSIYTEVTSGNYYTGYVTSFDGDGFTIQWTKTGTPTGTLTVHYTAFR